MAAAGAVAAAATARKSERQYQHRGNHRNIAPRLEAPAATSRQQSMKAGVRARASVDMLILNVKSPAKRAEARRNRGDSIPAKPESAQRHYHQ